MSLLLVNPRTKTYILGSFGLSFLLRKPGKDIMQELRILVYTFVNQSNPMTSKFAT